MGGIPDKEWNLSTGLPNPIIYIGLVVLCVMFSMRSSLRTHLQKQLSELWQQPEAPHHATSWDILGSYEEMEGRLWWPSHGKLGTTAIYFPAQKHLGVVLAGVMSPMMRL